MSARFENKVAIVTGASGDIGAAITRTLLEGGARVVLVDLDEAKLRDVAKSLDADGDRTLAVAADVTKADDTARYVQAATDRFGGVDALVNNAGVEGAVASIEAYPDDVFDQVMAVNVRGVFLGIKHVVHAMRARGGGSVVNLSSVAGLTGSPGVCAYNASKHAVIGLTRSAAVNLGPEAIRVNAVCPAPILGRMMRSLETGSAPQDPDAARAVMAAHFPMQRYGTPEEVASLVAYLCADEARYINGGIYSVDGGLAASQ